MKYALPLILIALSAFALPWEQPANKLKMGDGQTGEKTIEFNSGAVDNPKISAPNDTSLQLSKDTFIRGENLTVGSGVSSEKKILFDNGLGANNPYLSWDPTANKLSFSNDGLVLKKLGSGSGSGGSGGISILQNAGFEDGLINWVNSGGIFTQESYLNNTENNEKFAKFVANIAGDYVDSDCYAKPDFLVGGGMADIYYKSDASFSLQVIDCSTGTVIISEDELGIIPEFLKSPTQTFALASQMKLRILANEAGTIEFDNAYLGSNKGFIPGYETETAETKVALADTLSAGIVNNLFFTGLKIGKKYRLRYFLKLINQNDFAINVTVRNGGVSVPNTTISTDPANVGGNQAELIERTIEFIATASDVDIFCINCRASDYVGSGGQTQATLFSLGGDLLEAYTPEQAEFFYRGNVYGANINVKTNDIPNNANLILQNNEGSANITCVGGAQGGLTCPTGNEQLGIELNLPTKGKYEVCFQAPISVKNQEGLLARIGKYENLTDTRIENGDDAMIFEFDSSANNSYGSSLFCEFFDIDSVGKHTFKIYDNSTVVLGTIALDRSATNNNREGFWSVRLVENFASRPVIQNMVDTSVKAGVRVESCKVNWLNTIVSTTGNLCDNWVSSIVREATGRIQVNFFENKDIENFSCVIHGSATGVENSADAFGAFAAIRFYGINFIEFGYFQTSNGSRIDPTVESRFILTCVEKKQ